MCNDEFKYKLQTSYLPRRWVVVVIIVTALSCRIVCITVVVIAVIRALRRNWHCKHCNFTVIKAILSNRRIIHLSPIHKYAVDIRKVLNIFILKCFVLIKDNWIFTYNCWNKASYDILDIRWYPTGVYRYFFKYRTTFWDKCRLISHFVRIKSLLRWF